MKAHSWHAIGWLVWAVLTIGFFALWEAIGLANREDDKQPLTYYIRKLVGTWNNPVWWVVGAIILWMFVHFLIIHGE